MSKIIDEVIGYAKVNAESARSEDERAVWAAHYRTCVQIKADIDQAERSLNRYRYAVAFVGGDSWDWCQDCKDRFTWARSYDHEQALSDDAIAQIGTDFHNWNGNA